MIFIGYDEREALASRVCRDSILRHSPGAEVRDLSLKDEDVAAVYNRPYRMEGGQFIDGITGAPFSTQFAFSRFLVPHLAGYEGWHVFVDADFLFRADVAELEQYCDDKYAVRVVKHDHRPTGISKMDGIEQTSYPRKNWSSFILWNAGHPMNRNLSSFAVNSAPGLFLHGFDWLTDGEIGELPVEWNYLVDYTDRKTCPSPKAVHFTLGGPWWDEYRDVEYADEWREVEATGG